ncbi:MAG: cation:dicarboxylase symporter family transporter [Sphingomicrobium sp.]
MRILLALVFGLAAGGAAAALAIAPDGPVVTVAQLVGGLWVDGLRMTIVPLVFGLIVSGICAAGEAAAAGAIARRALILFAVLLLLAGGFAAVATPALLALWPIPAGAVDAFRAGLGAAAAPHAVPPAAEWVRQIVPTNPVAAAAEGAMLPLVLFALIFGFAAARQAPEPRRRIAGLFEAIVGVMMTIVHWVLLVAPLGVFALAFLLGVRTGFGAIGGLIHYVALISFLCVGVTVLMYGWVAWFGRASVSAFARAAWPAQAVAFSTQSSLASLPAMVEGARDRLNAPEAVSNIVLPLAVSLFRITSPAANLGVALYLAHLAGVEVSLWQIAAGAVVAAAVSLASVGLPSQVSFLSVVAPVCITVGAPVEMLGILLAVETIPDIFRTVGNVTADIAAVASIGIEGDDEPPGQDSAPVSA